MEEEVEAGMIEGVGLLFLADNYMSEAVYYQGNSINKEILS